MEKSTSKPKSKTLKFVPFCDTCKQLLFEWEVKEHQDQGHVVGDILEVHQ